MRQINGRNVIEISDRLCAWDYPPKVRNVINTRARCIQRITSFHNTRRDNTLRDRLTVTEIARLITEANDRCFYCDRSLGESFQIDHFVPLTTGGRHSRENIRVCCRPCNSRKGNRELTPQLLDSMKHLASYTTPTITKRSA